MNKPRAKGTGGETELLRLLNEAGFSFTRMPAGSRWDLEDGDGYDQDGETGVLAIRPDRGKWLFVMDLPTFMHVMGEDGCPTKIEVKRRKTSALHTMWDKEMDW